MRFLLNKKGQAMLGAGALAGVGFLIMAATAVYVMNSSKEKSVRMSQADARFINDMVFSRVGQAVAASAIICDEADGLCKWNDDPRLKFEAKNFGFKDLKIDNSSKTLSFIISSCLPSDPEKADFSTCVEKESEVKFQLSDLNKLKDLKILNWSADPNNTDKDYYGILISVNTSYNSVDTNKDESFVSNAVIRRPRFFLHIESGVGECLPTCHVPDGQTRSEALCFGKVKVVQGQNNMAKVSNLTVTNDGPGYLHRFNISRKFSRNTAVAETASLPPSLLQSKEIFSNNTGMSPGTSLSFDDNTLECVHWTSNVTIIEESGSDFYGVFTTYDPNSSVSTGSADYSFSKVEPQNPLFLGQYGTTVPSTKTEFLTLIYYRGQN